MYSFVSEETGTLIVNSVLLFLAFVVFLLVTLAIPVAYRKVLLRKNGNKGAGGHSYGADLKSFDLGDELGTDPYSFIRTSTKTDGYPLECIKDLLARAGKASCTLSEQLDFIDTKRGVYCCREHEHEIAWYTERSEKSYELQTPFEIKLAKKFDTFNGECPNFVFPLNSIIKTIQPRVEKKKLNGFMGRIRSVYPVASPNECNQMCLSTLMKCDHCGETSWQTGDFVKATCEFCGTENLTKEGATTCVFAGKIIHSLRVL